MTQSRYSESEFIRQNAMIQLSELYIQRSVGVEVSKSGATTTCSSYPSKERPEMAIDGKPNTKFLCRSILTKLTIALTSPAAVVAYDIRTANDFPGRDPTSWTFSCDLEDGTNTVLDAVTGYDPPNARFTRYGSFAV
eukprot:scaffold30332_cov30-Phaeocystis_antarctica.AAC.1